MNQKRTFSENIKGAWGLLPIKDKILLCMQSVLSVVVIVLVNLGINNIMPAESLVTVDLPLLSALFIVSAARSFPKRKVSMVICIICAILLLFLMKASLSQ